MTSAPRWSDVPAVASLDEGSAKPAEPELLQAVLQQSTPSPGQILLGQLQCVADDGEAGRAQVAMLGELVIAATLVPLAADDIGARIALSLLPDGRALVLGKLWQGAASVEVDGEARLIEAQHSLTLRCGEAAIVLHADGRIQLRGHYITSHASATQRIVGGSVHVN
jgi:hypothetical protein